MDEEERDYWKCLNLIEKYDSLTPFGVAVVGFEVMGDIHRLLDKFKDRPALYDWLNFHLTLVLEEEPCL